MMAIDDEISEDRRKKEEAIIALFALPIPKLADVASDELKAIVLGVEDALDAQQAAAEELSERERDD